MNLIILLLLVMVSCIEAFLFLIAYRTGYKDALSVKDKDDVVINEKNKAAVEQIIKFFTYKGDE